MAHFAVSAVGRDRPGIAAAIAAGLLEVEGNIEDSRMTNLGGHFAVMLLVSTPSADRDAVAAALAPVRAALDLEALTVAPVADAAATASPDHVITVYGADHPGIVHAVTTGLADSGVNIADLQTRVGGAPDAPIYMMILEVELAGRDADAIAEKLRGIGSRSEVEIDLRPLDAEAL